MIQLAWLFETSGLEETTQATQATRSAYVLAGGTTIPGIDQIKWGYTVTTKNGGLHGLNHEDLVIQT